MEAIENLRKTWLVNIGGLQILVTNTHLVNESMHYGSSQVDQSCGRAFANRLPKLHRQVEFHR